jgi:hypothetical protein
MSVKQRGLAVCDLGARLRCAMPRRRMR